MEPSQIRERILSEHRALGVRLDRLEALARGVERGRTPLDVLRDEVADLLVALREHMNVEDELLAPALLDADAWGDVRSAQLVEHHELQRAELDRLLQELRSPDQSRAACAELVLGLIDDLRLDIRREEKELLDPSVLRDDIITGGITS